MARKIIGVLAILIASFGCEARVQLESSKKDSKDQTVMNKKTQRWAVREAFEGVLFHVNFTTIEGKIFSSKVGHIEAVLKTELDGTYIQVNNHEFDIDPRPDRYESTEDIVLLLNTEGSFKNWKSYLQEQLKLMNESMEAREVMPPKRIKD